MTTIGANIWLMTAWALGALGSGVIAWALLGDWCRRLRHGRTPRCPKCWYDMRGASPDPGGVWTCPECGRRLKSARGLLRSRRRWKRAVLGGAALVVAWWLLVIPDVRTRGWWAAAPRPLLICMMPAVKTSGLIVVRPGQVFSVPPYELIGLYPELRRRLLRSEGELVRLYWPERWLLDNRARSTLASDGSPYWVRELAAHVLVTLRDDAVQAAEGQGRAFVVIEQMEKTYAQLTSFRCHGAGFSSASSSDERQFLIAMERPHRFRFELLNRRAGEPTPPSRFVLWQNDRIVTAWNSTDSSLLTDWQVMTLLGMNAQTPFGVSQAVPELLLRDEVPFVWHLSPQAAPQISEVVEGGRDCYRVDYPPARMCAASAIWIDKQTFLLLCMDDPSGYTTVYQPETNVPIDPTWFSFDRKHQENSPLQYTGPQARPSEK
jgi:hypothetical protein